MDESLGKEIQKLIENQHGDTFRLQFILECVEKGKKLYNSDKNYLSQLLEKYSKPETLQIQSEKPIVASTSETTFAHNIKEIPPSQIDIDDYKMTYALKSEKSAISLAVFLGLLGLGGIGHMLIGQVLRGVGILLAMLSVFAIMGVFIFGDLISIYTPIANIISIYGEFEERTYALFSIIGIPIILYFVGVGIYLWQIYDVRKLCKKYNNNLINGKGKKW